MAIFNMSGGGGKGYDGPYGPFPKGPAPDGFHVPSSNEWVALCGILTSTFGLSGNEETVGRYLKMPRAGNRNESRIYSIGTYGFYWSSTPSSREARRASEFVFGYNYGTQSFDPNNTTARKIDCLSMRCFKDIPIKPTSSWTTLYNGSSVASGAGVFYNTTDGLISVSGDGNNWYTIMDKNIGATSVFNWGDSLTDNNCGYFYQRGNNYGFPHSGTITDTATSVSVDMTTGNAYSSSTFITQYDGYTNATKNDIWGLKAEYVIIDGNNYYK